MFETPSYNINIYDELLQLKNSVAALKIYVAKLEQIISESNKKEDSIIPVDDNEFYTISDIVRKYQISAQTFCRWKRLVKLKTSGKQGKKIRYNKKNVERFFEKIRLLKISNPELFKVEIIYRHHNSGKL